MPQLPDPLRAAMALSMKTLRSAPVSRRAAVKVQARQVAERPKTISGSKTVGSASAESRRQAEVQACE